MPISWFEWRRAKASGESGMDAINRLHGGMLAGPTGFSLPTMIQ